MPVTRSKSLPDTPFCYSLKMIPLCHTLSKTIDKKLHELHEALSKRLVYIMSGFQGLVDTGASRLKSRLV